MIRRALGRLWPQSLQRQLLLATALALLLAQGISATLLYRAQTERREAGLVHAAAIRLFAAGREEGMFGNLAGHPPELMQAARQLRVERVDSNPIRSGERRRGRAEHELREILTAQGVALGDVAVVYRAISEDPRLQRRVAHRAAMLGDAAKPGPGEMVVVGIELKPQGQWLVVRMPVPPPERHLLLTLIGQTLLLYGLLIGAIALILSRLTRPLGALTEQVQRFAATREPVAQLEPQGPEDLRRLIVAHNAMEARITALLDEKDVMLGAIGHDLKTPLAALRVRIESVEDEGERARMAATIEDIVRSLDDILSLARVGRPSDPLEPAELSALVAQVAEEFEDLGEPVEFDGGERIVMPLRATWLRRAVRNLVSNALRYGKRARITLRREGEQAVIEVTDDGPGIPEDQIGRMLEPFTRGDPSRSSQTGGAGLGLTLARAIAEQHGGTLVLTNRRDPESRPAGLIASLRLPLT